MNDATTQKLQAVMAKHIATMIADAEMQWYDNGLGNKNDYIANYLKDRGVIAPVSKEIVERLCVEEALGIHLYDWQVDYIWNGSSYVPFERGSGRTLAYIIKLCLSEGDPLHIYWWGRHRYMCDEHATPEYFRFFQLLVVDVYMKLRIVPELNVRRIYFAPPCGFSHYGKKRGE